jgi:Sensors of blue-light using FAD
MLRRLAWSSVPSPSFSAARLNGIIAPSRRNNERNHISGMLLFTGANFLGILEGEKLDLRDLWLRLERDERHCDLLRIGDDLCGERWFPVWRIGYIADMKVDAQIESFRSLKSRIDLHRPGAGTPVETFDPLPSPSTSKWGEIIHPLMLSADSM